MSDDSYNRHLHGTTPKLFYEWLLRWLMATNLQWQQHFERFNLDAFKSIGDHYSIGTSAGNSALIRIGGIRSIEIFYEQTVTERVDVNIELRNDNGHELFLALTSAIDAKWPVETASAAQPPEQPTEQIDQPTAKRGPRNPALEEQRDIARQYLHVQNQVTQEQFVAQYGISVRTLQRYVDAFRRHDT